MDGSLVWYVCTNPVHIASRVRGFPCVTLHQDKWALCHTDGRAEVTGAHEWELITPTPIEDLRPGGGIREERRPVVA